MMWGSSQPSTTTQPAHRSVPLNSLTRHLVRKYSRCVHLSGDGRVHLETRADTEGLVLHDRKAKVGPVLPGLHHRATQPPVRPLLVFHQSDVLPVASRPDAVLVSLAAGPVGLGEAVDSMGVPIQD